MKVSFIAHAAILVEAGGVRILSDPWWQGPCFGAQWWLYPDPWLDPLDDGPLDFIYISHGHADHLHHGTLSRMPKSARVLVSDALDIGETIAAMGFEVERLPPRSPREIAPGVRVEISPTYGGDSLMVIDDGTERCFNLNDAVHACPQPVMDGVVADLRARYGRADYMFCGYGTASHFPNCYFVPGKDDARTASHRQSHFNGIWASLVAALEPRFAFPFAADLVFYEDELMWANEPVHNAERPTDVYRARYPECPARVYDIAPGFVIENGAVTAEVLNRPVSNDHLRAVKGREIERSNTVSAASGDEVEGLAEILRKNVELCGTYLREHNGDYRFLVHLKSADRGIEIRKKGPAIDVTTVAEPADQTQYDVVFTSRLSYLRRALTTKYGFEVIFVGSGGTFRYRDRAQADANLHAELSILLRQLDEAPDSRFGDQPRWLYRLKRFVKSCLGMMEKDFYDLGTWIIYDQR